MNQNPTNYLGEYVNKPNAHPIHELAGIEENTLHISRCVSAEEIEALSRKRRWLSLLLLVIPAT